MNNKLTNQMIEDYRKYVKPEGWGNISLVLNRRIETYGQVVKREKYIYPLDNSLYDYIYTFEDGSTFELDSIQMGL